jgi:hypothetical protein
VLDVSDETRVKRRAEDTTGPEPAFWGSVGAACSALDLYVTADTNFDLPPSTFFRRRPVGG